MKLILEDQRLRLLENGRASAKARAVDGNTPDHNPVVKLFTPWAGGTWLLTEIDPGNEDIAFGLCDLGMGCPELGIVDLNELRGLSGPGGLKVERDIHFEAKRPLSQYWEEARESGSVIA